MPQDIGKRIRRRRRALDLTQKDIADALSSGDRTVYQSDVSNWERGVVPHALTLMPIAKALDCDVRWLLTGQKKYAPAESAA